MLAWIASALKCHNSIVDFFQIIPLQVPFYFNQSMCCRNLHHREPLAAKSAGLFTHFSLKACISWPKASRHLSSKQPSSKRSIRIFLGQRQQVHFAQASIESFAWLQNVPDFLTTNPTPLHTILIFPSCIQVYSTQLYVLSDFFGNSRLKVKLCSHLSLTVLTICCYPLLAPRQPGRKYTQDDLNFPESTLHFISRV